MQGYLTFTMGAGGRWIAWHTPTKPPENATGRDLMSGPGPVHFAVGPTSEDALARLRSELSIQPTTGSQA